MNRIVSIFLTFVIIFATVSLSACNSTEMKKYYAERDNYITATGSVSHIAYDEENEKLFISFADLNPEFNDNTFKIAGQNYLIVKSRSVQQKLKLGVEVEFITAPRYFGDGYAMPIVAMTIDGEVLLAFNEGFENLQVYLKNKT